MEGRQIALSEELMRLPVPGAVEEGIYARGFSCIAGLDEVGRGSLAGPVIAAAVILRRGFSHPEIKDSKVLNAGQREVLAPVIQQNAVTWGLGIVHVEELDRINILRASLLAMVKALKALRQIPDCLLIDGPSPVHRKSFKPMRDTCGESESGRLTLFEVRGEGE